MGNVLTRLIESSPAFRAMNVRWAALDDACVCLNVVTVPLTAMCSPAAS